MFAVVLALLAYASGVDVRDSSVTELAVASSEGDKSRAGVRGGLLVQGQADASLALGEGSTLSMRSELASKLASRNSLAAAVGEAVERRQRKASSTSGAKNAPTCPEGQTMFEGCAPCRNECGKPASTMCTRVCNRGCACPSGTWTDLNGACFNTMACTSAANAL